MGISHPFPAQVLSVGRCQALEDTTRHNADYEANNSPTRLVDPTSGAVVDALWREFRVGDLVVVRNRGGTRERNSQLQRLRSRPFSTRLG